MIEMIAPFQRFVKVTVNTTEDLWIKYFGLIHVHEENRRLKTEINDLKMENYRYRELLATHGRLHKLLQFKPTMDWPVSVARVIGRDPTGWFQSVIIDKGKKAGLKVNMPVVNANGVVGRLVSVSYHYSKVLLVIDQNSAVDCVTQDSREKGILKGLSNKLCRFDYVLKTNKIAVGERLITSGMGRVFPKGIPVGRVIGIADKPGEFFKDIKVRPMVDFSRLEEVLVILKEDPLVRHVEEKE
jgi:rod shape-determining protein MreC